MTNVTTSRSIAVYALIGAALALSALAVMALPGLVGAATYAYVNQSGEVRTIDSDTSANAVLNAVGIHANSGVMLLTTTADHDVVGDQVQGM